jgi:hypothetical protein
MMIFVLGYAVFVPLESEQNYRLWFMSSLIVVICLYMIINIELLAGAFRKKILLKLWSDF